MIHQGTEEWRAARLGKITASRLHDAFAKTKSGWGASRYNYMAELLAERLTGSPSESYTNGAMQWGIEHEAEARAAYEFYRDATVAQVGFVVHPEFPDTGASPDGFVGDDGLVEFKCPETKKHLDTLLGSAIDRRYLLQMQWQMACTGRMWCDFVSYDPRLPEAYRLHVQRVERDEALILEIGNEVAKFWAELTGKEKRLRERFEIAA